MLQLDCGVKYNNIFMKMFFYLITVTIELMKFILLDKQVIYFFYNCFAAIYFLLAKVLFLYGSVDDITLFLLWRLDLGFPWY